MGKSAGKLGPVVDFHLGYNVRQMTSAKTDDKKRTTQVHNGKYGIYARKNFVKEVNKLEEARPAIDAIIKENKK